MLQLEVDTINDNLDDLNSTVDFLNQTGFVFWTAVWTSVQLKSSNQADKWYIIDNGGVPTTGNWLAIPQTVTLQLYNGSVSSGFTSAPTVNIGWSDSLTPSGANITVLQSLDTSDAFWKAVASGGQTEDLVMHCTDLSGRINAVQKPYDTPTGTNYLRNLVIWVDGTQTGDVNNECLVTICVTYCKVQLSPQTLIKKIY